MNKSIAVFSLLFFFFFSPENSFSQDETWLYLRAKDTTVAPSFEKKGDQLEYTGENYTLKSIFVNYKILDFKKTYRKASKENLKKTFFVRVNSELLLSELLRKTPELFISGEVIPLEDRKIYEPNDYGLTSTIGENIGLPVNLDYLDFLGLPEAWYYTTGSRDVMVGISDAVVNPAIEDFKGKTEIFSKASLSNGHGYSTAATAAGQGDNGYGIPGICYDCGIMSTSYGQFNTLDQLKELSNAGARVINCSWVGSKFYEEAQIAIEEMFNNGTIIVASAGNKDWQVTKGKKIFYPASYDKVICVSSAMYKHESPRDNILTSPRGFPYGLNIRGYLSRTVGFKDHNTNNKTVNYPVGIATLNPEVDLLAPTVGMFRYSQFILNNELLYSTSETTSSASPQVSGTIGLMFSLNPCLPTDEVESILKITSLNIDDIGDNIKYKGNYGAGILQTGKAVKLVYDLYTEGNIAYIENQSFERWSFKITALSKEVHIKNQEFKDNASLVLTAKNRIVLKPGTKLQPNSMGSIALKIKPSLEKKCDLQLRDPSIED